ncbi:MAG: Uma2 family endonuclease [Candidatus Rokubacteria bacterium]|nr:Uma2 family endonuclease [Candidatus Rokubacteria bacterium]
MGEMGILHEDDPSELIEGDIVEMSRITSYHAATVTRLDRLFFSRGLSDQATVSVRNPVTIPRLQSEPRPDLMLLVHRDDFYRNALPEPPDVLLLIEVADSSLAYDRRTKLPLYARAGVTESWLVDLEANRVEIYRGPTETGYRDVPMPRVDETFAPAAFPTLGLTLRDVLG